MKLIRLSLIIGALLGGATVATVAGAAGTPSSSAIIHHHFQKTWGKHAHIDCTWAAAMCTEVQQKLSQHIFGHYVGHDEPSVLFDSHIKGSGNKMDYNIILPKDPSASNPNAKGKGYQFELSGADWFGMAICDTQSYPEQVHKFCPRDSNSNIRNLPQVSPTHTGQAYMEMQFYPPGWIKWPTWQKAVGASSCSATQWCAALNIDSLSYNPVTDQQNNTACQNSVGEEPVNFAFITKNGKSTGPANPIDATTSGTFTPNRKKDLFMNPGDHVNLKIHDTANGVQIIIRDLTTGQSGSMTASKANGFAQIKWDPTGESCTAIPYDFHPMYSTSTPKTRVTWAAGAYNVAMDTEIGHFQGCTGPVPIPASKFGEVDGNVTICPPGDKEGNPGNKTASDPNVDDAFCFPAKEGTRFKVAGCTYTNIGFDGYSYQKLWPDGNTKLRPTPFQFTSPKTGPGYKDQYSNASISVDLPAIESESGNQPCDVSTGSGCTHIPITDNGSPANFYPYYSITNSPIGCVWQMGNNKGKNDFGGEGKQYGPLYKQAYTTPGGGYVWAYEDYLNNLKGNPCKAPK